MIDPITGMMGMDWFRDRALLVTGHPAIGLVALDAVIGLSFLSSAVFVVLFASRFRSFLSHGVYWVLVLCLLACGSEHFVAIGAAALSNGLCLGAKGITALVALATAISLWPMLPRLKAMPTARQLQSIHADLSECIVERDLALARLVDARAERDAAQEMLRQSQRVEALGQVAGGLAHDFNNLLGVIVGNLDRASRLMATGTKPYKAVIDAMSASDRATALVSRLMAFARREPPKLAHVPIDTVIANLQPLVVGLAPGCDVRFDLRCSWQSHVDESQLENAILNLVVNARDAMADGGALTIRSSALKAADIVSGECVLIEVEDTGSGMPDDIKAKAFEPFFTTKPAGLGTGLGLSQVSAFIRQIGGAVHLESEMGQGTRIALYIPRSHGAAEAEQRAIVWALQPNAMTLTSPSQTACERSGRSQDGDARLPSAAMPACPPLYNKA